MDEFGRIRQAAFTHGESVPGLDEAIQAVGEGADALAVVGDLPVRALRQLVSARRSAGVVVLVSPRPAAIAEAISAGEAPLECLHLADGDDPLPPGLCRTARERGWMLATTPERLASHLLPSLSREGVGLVIVDEAQSVSPARSDFRPAYLGLAGSIDVLGRPPVLAVATLASCETSQDISARLGLRLAAHAVADLYRPNLFLDVRPVANLSDKLRHLVDVVSDAQGPGVVLTSTVRNAETVYRRLLTFGVPTEIRHSQLSANAIRGAEARFMDGTSRVIVAASEAGDGIERPDIRYVVHYNMPASIEAYWREARRAGFDGAPACSVILGGPQDRRTHEIILIGRVPRGSAIRAVVAVLRRREGGRFSAADLSDAAGVSLRQTLLALAVLRESGIAVRGTGGDFSAAVPGTVRVDDLVGACDLADRLSRRKIERMTRYCLSTDCRWAGLLEHFEGRRRIQSCGHCDSCIRVPQVAASGGPASARPC